jgi:hypothetical protein
MDFGFIEFGVGMGVTIVGVIVKDAIMKNNFKHQISALIEEMKAIRELENVRRKVDEKQDAEITTLREESVRMRERQANFRERLENLYENEIKAMQKTLIEVQQLCASLNATLQGLNGWLKRVDEKLSNDNTR